MIDEEATKKQFGYYSTDLKPLSAKKIVTVCDICGKARELQKNHYHGLCRPCATSRAKTVEKIQRTCEQCGKPFEVAPSTVIYKKAIFCSKSCSGKAHSGDRNINWKGGNIKRECKLCGKVFYVPPSRVKIGEGIYCSHTCSMKDHFKEMSHRSKPQKTKPELTFEAICTKHNLPFKYVGDSSLWIGKKGGKQLNPDFIATNGEKIVVEIFGDYWHSPLLNHRLPESTTLPFKRKHFKMLRWKSCFIWGSDLERPDAEAFVLKEVGKLLGNATPVAALDQWTLLHFSSDIPTEAKSLNSVDINIM